MMLLSTFAYIIIGVVQKFEYSLRLPIISFLLNWMFNYKVLISLKLLAQSSDSMSLTATVFSLDNYI